MSMKRFSVLCCMVLFLSVLCGVSLFVKAEA